MRRLGSGSPDPAVVDTVVVHYFLLVDRFDVLVGVLGSPIMVSRVVYDPGEPEGVEEDTLSELRRGIRYFRRRAADDRRTDTERGEAGLFADRLSKIDEHIAAGRVEIVDMNDSELDLFARLGSGVGSELGLGDGEAATLTIALGRQWVFVSDDQDAIRVLQAMYPSHPFTRIRRILTDAASFGLITVGEANRIHEEMRACGFWDRGVPFP